DKARANGRDAAYLDRLLLNAERVEGMATALEEIAELPDPVGRTLHETTRPNGLVIRRVATPLGVIGMIYESRPNVGADAGGLCLKSGNAVILRGGSDSLESSREIVACLGAGLREAGLPAEAVQLVDSEDREIVAAILQCTEYLDLVIPRGGKGLVSLVRDTAKVPTLLHLDGNNHTYVHAAANLRMAATVVTNAKMRRTGVCGATETVVVDREIAAQFIPMLLNEIGECEVRGEDEARELDTRVGEAGSSDWDTEFLAPVIALKIVDGEEEALSFIKEHHSAHTDAIITDDQAVADRFLRSIDSAVVMHNASTQFSDGGEFGMGAEIGIATGKLHARGPVGVEQLTTMKYEVCGTGQTRA
ncbi:MAG: glutamate-5-semialdehyde dehydrogenase, partial [Pseudomonadota bacterium]